MKGTILDFSIQTNVGIISGEDGNRYHFGGSEWKESTAPQRGVKVDFDFDSAGQAKGIYKAIHGHATSTTTLANPDKPEQDYQFIDWFVKCLKNYANFNGRARRKEFWFFMLAKYGLLLILLVIDAVLGTEGALCILGALGLALPEWAAGCRRLHDIDKTGWLQVIAIIPFGIILLMIWYTKEGDPHSNQYGEPAQ